MEDAKQNLDDLDKKLAAFKNQHMGQLPGDEDNNLKILMGLNSQLDANTQNPEPGEPGQVLHRIVAGAASWRRGSRRSRRPIRKRCSSNSRICRHELIDLQARYTDDHPDVIKTKADIAEMKKRLAEVNNGVREWKRQRRNDKASGIGTAGDSPTAAADSSVSGFDRPRTTQDQKRLQQEIAVYQSRVASSPAIEEQYKELARDYDNAQKVYQDDLAKQSKSKMASQAEQQEQGEQMALAESGQPAGFAELSEPAVVCGRRTGCRPGIWGWCWRCGWNFAISRFAPSRMPRPLWNCRCWLPCRGWCRRPRTTATARLSLETEQAPKRERKRPEFREAVS